MKRLVWLAVGAILLLGVVAVGAILVATGGDLGGWSGGATATQATGPAGGVPIPASLAGPTGPTGPTGYPPGPRRVQLPAGRVRAFLAEPLAPCFRSHPMPSTRAATLALELEAQGGAKGGFAVLDVQVRSWGDASRGLVDCATRTLRGQVIPGGGAGFTAGDRATTELVLDPPPSIQPPPPEPPPTTLPTNRQRPPVRRGGSG